MNRLLIIVLLSFLLQGCSDGDIIVSNFNFENAELKTCGDVGNYVFYKENRDVFESLSLRLGTTDSIYKTAGTKVYELNGSTSFVNYRSYDGPLGNNYFCSSIPPTSPKVITDFLAASGTVEVIVTFIYDTPEPRESNNSQSTLSADNLQTNSGSYSERRTTIRKNVQIILKNIVLVNEDQQIIPETIDMGTIQDVRIEEVAP